MREWTGCINLKEFNILSRFGVTYVFLDWVIVIDTLFTQLGTACNIAKSLIYTHYSSPLHTH
jgi:hypothetical protein